MIGYMASSLPQNHCLYLFMCIFISNLPNYCSDILFKILWIIYLILVLTWFIEYGIEGQVSTRADVYSYGIMLIETFTSKKPTNEIFTAELNLKHWVNDMLPISFMEVDTNLLSGDEKCFAAKKQCVLSILNLAMECTIESTDKRINTREIVTRLLKFREALVKSVEMARVQANKFKSFFFSADNKL